MLRRWQRWYRRYRSWEEAPYKVILKKGDEPRETRQGKSPVISGRPAGHRPTGRSVCGENLGNRRSAAQSQTAQSCAPRAVAWKFFAQRARVSDRVALAGSVAGPEHT